MGEDSVLNLGRVFRRVSPGFDLHISPTRQEEGPSDAAGSGRAGPERRPLSPRAPSTFLLLRASSSRSLCAASARVCVSCLHGLCSVRPVLSRTLPQTLGSNQI